MKSGRLLAGLLNHCSIGLRRRLSGRAYTKREDGVVVRQPEALHRL